MHVEVVERDFTRDGRMKPIAPADRRRLRGYIPFFSVDTREEADALVEAAVKRGEFFRRSDGILIETTLLVEQTVDNLKLAGERLAAIHGDL